MPETLRALPARRIIAFIADAAERWANADFAPRVRATRAIIERLGYTEPVVDYALDRLFSGITRAALESTITAELGSVEALDEAMPRVNVPAAWARGVDRVTIVSSDTTIGVAIVPAVFALCAKCDVVVKDRADALVAEFFATLAQEHPAFAAAAQARVWRGGDDSEEADLLSSADVVVAFGRDDALRDIRAKCGVETRFVPFGHRASIGRLTATDVAALDDALAERIVRDALLYDGEGCLSLHALFVETRWDGLLALAEPLAAACARVATEFPATPLPPAREMAVASWRNVAAFRAAGGHGTVHRSGGVTLVLDVPPEEPPPLLPRVLPVFRVDGDAEIVTYVAEHRLPV
ncbi:MAG TPA: acyl-CoA reductase, partial [Candidatus Acidoferrum sp.]|nr:acyl-CoA reductase [Candidatus Acidoferrum sp.]